ncbi:MAG: histidine kinase [Ignavibacteriae bacterium]|nr:histidine kinase [Ignavibacteriota bacterium]
MLRILYILRILVLCFVPLSLHAQYVLKQWNVEHGLPQSSIRCITQARDGHLWIGTWNGLARFDGVRMTVFNALNTPELHPSISALYEDAQHHLWIGTDGGGLVQYKDGAFVKLDSADGIAATMINSITGDKEGRIWLGTDKGFYVYTRNRFLHFETINGFPDKLATYLVPASDGSMYLEFVATVFHVRLSGDSLVVLEKPFRAGGYRIDIDSSGALWYGVRGKGLVKRRGSKEYVDRRFVNVHSKQVFIPRNQQKWVMTPRGAYVLENGKITHIQTIDEVDFSNVSHVFEDREGILWVGVEGSGLLRLRRKQIQTFTTLEGLETNAVMCGMEDREGNVWIGTWLGGLSCRKPGNREFTPIKELANGLTVMSVCQSRDGTIWVGTWGQGVYTIREGRVGKFTGKGLGEDTSIRAIVADPRGGVWIGTVWGTVGYYHGTEEMSWDSKEGIPGMVNTVLLTRNGELWAGTDGGGIARIINGHVSVINKSIGLLDEFAHVSIEDTDGAIWLTSKRGLQRWKNGVLSTVPPSAGFTDDHAQFIQDNDGNYWIGGTHGIHRIRKADLNAVADGKLPALDYLTIGKADGMPVEECSGGSNQLVWKTREGALWFSTTHGAVRIEPNSVGHNPVPPGVMIAEVLVENKLVQWNQEITLSPQETKIEFHYTGINFSAPERIRFKYKMEGFEDEWRDVGRQRLAQYTNLEPGNYRFRVIAANNTGVWNEQGASLAVVVLPPFYVTWWFRTLVIFAVVGTVVLAVRRRISRIRKEEEISRNFARQVLRSQETERQRIANELHDSLGQNLLVIKNRLIQSQKQSYSNTEQLNEVSDLVSQTIQEVRGISHNLRPHQLDQLGLSKTLRALVKTVRDSSSISLTGEIDDLEDALSTDKEIALFRIVQESLNNILKHSQATEASVLVKRNTTVVSVIIRDNGKGMHIATEQQREELGSGFGISGIKARAQMFGWVVFIQSEPNNGTAINLTVPISQLA